MSRAVDAIRDAIDHIANRVQGTDADISTVTIRCVKVLNSEGVETGEVRAIARAKLTLTVEGSNRI